MQSTKPTLSDAIQGIINGFFTTQEILDYIHKVCGRKTLSDQDKESIVKALLSLNNGTRSIQDPQIYLDILNITTDPLIYTSILEHYINREKTTFEDLIKFLNVGHFGELHLENLIDHILAFKPNTKQLDQLIISMIVITNYSSNSAFLKKVLDSIDLKKLSVNTLINLMEYLSNSDERKSSFIDAILKKRISSSDLAKVLTLSIYAEGEEITTDQISELLKKFIDKPNKSNTDIALVCDYLDDISEPNDLLIDKIELLEEQLKSITDFSINELMYLIPILEGQSQMTIDYVLDQLINHPKLTPQRLVAFISNTKDFFSFPYKVQNKLFETLAEHPDTTREQLFTVLKRISKVSNLVRANQLPGAEKVIWRFAQFDVLRNEITRLQTNRYANLVNPQLIYNVVYEILSGRSRLTWGAEKGPILEASSVLPNSPHKTDNQLLRDSQTISERLSLSWSK